MVSQTSGRWAIGLVLMAKVALGADTAGDGKVPEQAAYLGSGPDFVRIERVLQKAARSEATFLILGETGAGKEVLAHEIVRRSDRAHKPFVPIHMGALPEGLIESELFGHAKGAFTGASTRRIGLLEQADGGTVFLDEIGEMPLVQQVKLLRFLESGEIRPVGASETKILNVRVIAATNRDLAKWVREGKFREDLYYRLAIFSVTLPPLRERLELDLLYFARLFLDNECRAQHKNQKTFSTDALDLIREYPWHGNLRELANAMEHAVAMADDSEVQVEDLPPRVQNHKKHVALPECLRLLVEGKRPMTEILNAAAVLALDRNGGDLDKTAAELELPPAVLHTMVRQHLRIVD